MCKVLSKGNGHGFFFVLPAALALFLFSATIVNADYSSWQYSKKLYLNTTSTGANVAGNVTNFPVLVRLTTTSSDIFSQVAANGADLRFEQNGTALPYEIEQWDATAKNAAIWVKVPTVYGNNLAQYFTMYWGKSGATSESNGASVFETSNSYVGAWHLNNNVLDASANAKNGTDNGSSNATGILAQARSFNGASSRINIPQLFSSLPAALTFSCWINPATINSPQMYSLYTGLGGEAGLNVMNSTLCFQVKTVSTGWNNAITPSGTITTGNWYHVTGTWTKGGPIKCYVNGVEKVSASTPNEDINSPSGFISSIGAYSGGTGSWFNGKIDEPEISTVVRSADWIKLCYENQKSSQTMVSDQTMSTIVLTNDGRGTTSVVSGATQGMGTLNVTINANPYPGFTFVRWIVYGQISSVTLGNATQTTTTVTVTNAAATVMAMFETVDAVAGTGGGVAYPNNCGPGDNLVVDRSVTVAALNSDKTLETMTVNGRVKCDGLKIQNWLFSQKAPPDYVFDKKYSLLDLNKVEEYIQSNGHLPEIPSAKEMQKSGIELTEFNMMLLKKIEELTLYTIEMKKELEALKVRK
jgi:hypothetical protein